MSTAVRNESAKRERTSSREIVIAWLHLAVLWMFAVVQPLFGVLSDSPEFFVARGNTSADILLLTFGLTLVPPTLLLALEAPFVYAPPVRRKLHVLLIGLLTALAALQLLKDVADGPAAVLLPVAIVLGAAGAIGYMRVRSIPSILTVLSPAVVVFAALFLLVSPVSKLVLPQESASAGVGSGARTDTPVVMVVFDEFSGISLLNGKRQIDAERYPNFAELAAESTWYRDATSVSGFTPQAVPAILTGNRNEAGSVPIASEHPRSLFTFLGSRRSFNVEEPVTAICPAALCRRTREASERRLESLISDLTVVSARQLLPKELAEDLPPVDQGFADFGGDDSEEKDQLERAAAGHVAFKSLLGRPAILDRFLEGIRAQPKQPPLHFLHVALPHIPWEFLPTGQRYIVNGEEAPGLEDNVWTKSPSLVRQAQQRYLLQVGYADHALGRLMARLRKTGLYDRALVVVTADHGIAFTPGKGRRALTPETVGQLASVPLFFKAPKQQEGTIDGSHVRTLDILPMIAQALQVTLPWKTDGQSPTDRSAGAADSVTIGGVRVPWAEFERQRKAALASQIDLFGTGIDELFAFGDDGDLVGRRPPAQQARAGGIAELDARRLFAEVSPGAQVVPAYITGRLIGQRWNRIAVAVNGRIRAVSHSFAAGDQVRFGAMVPPRAFRPGRNSITLFGVRRRGPDRVVAKLKQRDAETFQLVQDELIRGSSGREFNIVPQAVQGFLDELDIDGRRLLLSGWSANKVTGPADLVLVFADGEFLAAVSPSRARPDVADDLGPRTAKSGFQVATKLHGRPRDFRVFGLSGKTASELPRAGGAG